MRQSFRGQATTTKKKAARTLLDFGNVPRYFDSCLAAAAAPMRGDTTPDESSVIRCPLLLNEFVTEPFALEAGGDEGFEDCSSPRMRPFSDAAVVATAVSSATGVGAPGAPGASTGVATTVTATASVEPSCCSARPLAIGVVVVSMSFALIYFLMIVPMTSPTPTSSDPVSNDSTSSNYSHVTTTPENALYRNLNDKLHRHQIPLIHIPLLYEVQLKLFLPWRPNVTFGTDDFAVEGRVRVTFRSGGGARVQLHTDSTDQYIGECVVRDELGREIFVKHKGRGFAQVLDLHLAADMIQGMNYTLDVQFRGHIATRQPYGLFAVPYQTKSETRYIVATQLQQSEARTVFPCIDIPEVKAQFDTTIIHPTGTTAVSNMKENGSSVDGGWTTTSFHRTPPMSTYLFAFFVSDYPYLEVISSQGVRSRVYCDPAKLKSAELMTNSIGPLLGFYEDYFGIPYPLDKLDVVILPVLSVSAMENWGMITVRQADGLYRDGLFPISQMRNALEIIAHEVAHQWFGNLATMKWWNDLWLNEGFATMISVRALDFLQNTTWRYKDNTAELMCVTLRTDQMPSSLAISTNPEIDIQRHMEMQPSRKTIVYKKAAIILRMIERLVDEEIFRQGLNLFLNTFLYKNADHEDLFNVLVYVHDSSAGGHLSGQNFSLSDVMNTWIRQNFFPVVHVNRKEGNIVTLRQERYNHDPRALPDPSMKSESEYVWKIPIFYSEPVSGKHRVFWLTDKQPVLFDMAGLLLVDQHQETYMRLRYDMSMYTDITMQLLKDHTVIPANSRSRLLDDTLAMAEHEQMSYKVPFNMTMYMTKETAYRPFQTFSAYLDFFLPRMFVHEQWPVYREYLHFIFGKPFDRLHRQGLDIDLDKDVDAYSTREIVVNRACLLGYEPCVRMARDRFAELRANCSGEHQLLSDIECNKIPFYLRQYIYAAAIEYGTDEDFAFLLEKWRIEHYMLERDRIFHGMCFTGSRSNSDQMWNALLENRHREHIFARSVSCSKKLTAQTLIIDFFEDRPELLKELFKSQSAKMTLQPLLMLGLRQTTTREQVERVTTMLAPLGNNSLAVDRLMLGHNINQVRYRLQWRNHMGAYIIGNASEAIIEMKKWNSD